MRSISLALVLVLVLVLVSGSEGSSWSINVTRRLQASPGSDVMVPCTFTFPPLSTDVRVLWKNSKRSAVKTGDSDLNAFVFHPNQSLVVDRYRGRTSLPGNQANRNDCSLKIRNISESEPRIYLRVLTAQNSFSFWDQFVTISVSGGPGLTPATTEVPNYVVILVPLLVLLLLIAAAAAFLVCSRRRRFPHLRESSGPDGNNTNMEVKISTLDKEMPAVKKCEEPIYVNFGIEASHVTHRAEVAENIYANVNYV